MLGLDPLFLTFSVFRLTPGTSLYGALKGHMVHRKDLPRLTQKGITPVLGDLLADMLFPTVQRVRCMKTVLGTASAAAS